MWKSISQFKNKYAGKKAIIVGTGPSGDYIENVKQENKESIIIGINRSICLTRMDFCFVDSPDTLRIIKYFHANTQFFCMPVFSRKKINVNDLYANKLKGKIILFVWVYDDIHILNATDYSLNDELLFIKNGSVHSVLHFCSNLGIKDVILVGCDGNNCNDRIYAKEILLRFNIKGKRKRMGNYIESVACLNEIAKKLEMNIENVSERYITKRLASK